jgi:hypothetical protein
MHGVAHELQLPSQEIPYRNITFTRSGGQEKVASAWRRGKRFHIGARAIREVPLVIGAIGRTDNRASSGAAKGGIGNGDWPARLAHPSLPVFPERLAQFAFEYLAGTRKR